MNEVKYQDLLNQAVTELLQVPDLSDGVLQETAMRLGALVEAKRTYGRPEIVPPDVSTPPTTPYPVTPTVEPVTPTVEPETGNKKPSRKPKEATAAPTPPPPAGGDTPGDQLNFKFPNLATLTQPQDPEQVKVTHKAAYDAVTEYAKQAVSAQISKGNAHGNPLAKAAARVCHGTKIADVAPAKWGILTNLYEAIRCADLLSVPPMEATDDAAYDQLLKKIILTTDNLPAPQVQDEL